VFRSGGNEDEAIAAILHDAAEDRGGAEVLEEIGRLFGRNVKALVKSASEELDGAVADNTDANWKERKAAALRSIAKKSGPALRVALADKVANARSIVADLSVAKARGAEDGFWDRFRGPDVEEKRKRQLWFYDELAKGFEARKMPEELDSLRLELRRA